MADGVGEVTRTPTTDASAETSATRTGVTRPAGADAEAGGAGANPDRVRIFDTTLRDGEQTPGVALTVEEKVEVARWLEALGVDVIEAGFPVASDGEFEAVGRIAEAIQGPVVAALARTAAADIDRAWAAIRHARRPRIHVFVSTSPVHLEAMLRMTEDQVLRLVEEMVAYARSLCPDVEFSAQDATRSDVGFLAEVTAAAIEAGATTINLPDTVGYATPWTYARMFQEVMARVPGSDRVVFSAHTHDDLGMAVANALAAVRVGVRQVECTINGIGERAGNCSLEEVVMALAVRGDVFGATTGVDTQRLVPTSQLVSRLTGVPVPPNKAVVGANAFAHESGIHQDGVIKNPLTYEIIRPEAVGAGGSQLVLGKHSGRHAVRVELERLGFRLPEEAFREVFRRFKALADRREFVSKEALARLAAEVLDERQQESGAASRLAHGA
ncbi:2-isopropylmalate synthase [Thermaerobacter sp. FW80]|uniref:2-isopropylmalate synthase n=1 Tax=Thermaerobacter sp. FW80 TaxID=2546351 RepID=UPI000DB38D7A|nr:2-isopropylmalate synthase [Thermaerobacter sp. FW80]PZN07153.1 MAG: 2-isopropylmalate synthase [Bacillota bacterium]QBS36603.1 2-isopropylmalate synthase [Thermaerobacter sp. FW80]